MYFIQVYYWDMNLLQGVVGKLNIKGTIVINVPLLVAGKGVCISNGNQCSKVRKVTSYNKSIFNER